MKNIIYSTTRQWNSGDEFILMGCINLLKTIVRNHNPIIYNRNPDIRPENGEDVFYRNNKLPLNFSSYNDLVKNSAKYHYGFHDNSIKFNTDSSFADLAVFAGSPELFNSRCHNFYQHILKNNLPVLILGAGSIPQSIPEYMEEVISKSLLFTVRDKSLAETDFGVKNNAVYIPCPALFATPLGTEKKINEVKSIGLVYQSNFENSVRCNCIDNESHDFCINLYQQIINRYKNYKISIICHYIDEISPAYNFFSNENVDIRYSYDSKDYIDIYKEFDLILSPRVHGCGMSSSLGIPSFIIKHDARGNTADGFLAEEIKISDNINEIIDKIDLSIRDIENKNKKLIDWKSRVFREYSARLTVSLGQAKPIYKDKYKNLSFGKELNMLTNIEMKYRLYRFLSEITFGKTKQLCKERKYIYKRLKIK